MAKDDPKRDARLAEALRQNLRLRKAQARAADAAPTCDESQSAPALGESAPVKEPSSPT